MPRPAGYSLGPWVALELSRSCRDLGLEGKDTFLPRTSVRTSRDVPCAPLGTLMLGPKSPRLSKPVFVAPSMPSQDCRELDSWPQIPPAGRGAAPSLLGCLCPGGSVRPVAPARNFLGQPGVALQGGSCSTMSTQGQLLSAQRWVQRWEAEEGWCDLSSESWTVLGGDLGRGHAPPWGAEAAGPKRGWGRRPSRPQKLRARSSKASGGGKLQADPAPRASAGTPEKNPRVTPTPTSAPKQGWARPNASEQAKQAGRNLQGLGLPSGYRGNTISAPGGPIGARGLAPSSLRKVGGPDPGVGEPCARVGSLRRDHAWGQTRGEAKNPGGAPGRRGEARRGEAGRGAPGAPIARVRGAGKAVT